MGWVIITVAMVDVDGSCQFSALSLHSSNEPGELSQWLCSWWQHHKHWRGYYYYFFYYAEAGVRRRCVRLSNYFRHLLVTWRVCCSSASRCTRSCTLSACGTSRCEATATTRSRSTGTTSTRPTAHSSLRSTRSTWSRTTTDPSCTTGRGYVVHVSLAPYLLNILRRTQVFS